MRKPHKHESSEARLRDGLTSSSSEAAVMAVEPRGQPEAAREYQRKRMNTQEQKTFAISKREVKLAWMQVRAKGGIGGVDGQGIKDFERNLEKNLYKLWNRMSSGSYHPKAVLRVEIPKGDGTKRPLGIPTVTDRIAQQVVKERFEKVVDEFFHQDSYGYRANKSAQEAVRTCRQRCWEYDWVLDVDIQKFFDTIEHELMMKAVEHHTTESWMVLYIQRWLKAPVQNKNGEIEEAVRGTPQGGVISPVLANLYLHYAFDRWMERSFPGVKFERYADDIVIHCTTKEQSEQIQHALAERLEECRLKLHPEKTKVVYCRDGARQGRYPTKKFTFLGYTFQPRDAQNRQTKETFTRFLPAVSTAAAKKFRTNIKDRGIFNMHHLSVDELARQVNLLTKGWYEYFRHFYKSALNCMSNWLDTAIVRWLKRKLRLKWRDAYSMLQGLLKQNPKRFAHWLFRYSGRAV